MSANETSTVLIVDDDRAARELLDGLLASYGYRLVFAAEGPEAIRLAAEGHPDLVLLDVMMAGMDGFEVCRRLRADPRTAEVPVLLVTALDDAESRLQGIEAGADDFISKPFDRIELRARVRTIAQLNRYRRLQAERAKFEWVVEQSPHGYVVLQEGDQVVYANPQAQQYLGQMEGEALAQDPSFLHWAAQHYRFEPPETWSTWPEPEPGPRYLVQPESDQARAFWLLVETLDTPSGPGSQRIVRLQDVTAQVVAQRDLWKFHTLISHKLRTPLTGLVSSVEMLAEDLTEPPAGETAPTVRHNLAQLARIARITVRNLSQEIQDILEQLDARDLGKGGFRFRLSELETLSAGIAASLGLPAVTVAVPPELQEMQLALSHPAVELILWEILENTRKFHPRQAPRVEVSVRPASGRMVTLSIGDDGLTLSPAQLARVWTPYYQGERNFTGTAPGMGLGLSTVASLVWETGGQCRMINRQGPGVVVELTVPTAQLEGREDLVRRFAGGSVGRSGVARNSHHRR